MSLSSLDILPDPDVRHKSDADSGDEAELGVVLSKFSVAAALELMKPSSLFSKG